MINKEVKINNLILCDSSLHKVTFHVTFKSCSVCSLYNPSASHCTKLLCSKINRKDKNTIIFVKIRTFKNIGGQHGL